MIMPFILKHLPHSTDRAEHHNVSRRGTLSFAALVLTMLSTSGCRLPQAETAEQVELKQDLAEVPNAQVLPASSTTNIQSSPASTQLEVEGLQPKAGVLRIAVFENGEGFPNHDHASFKLSQAADTEVAKVEIAQKLKGNYAIAVYQDLNEDGMLNRGTFGQPTEPFGFSNNAMGTMGPPSFEAAVLNPDELAHPKISLTHYRGY